MGQSLACYKLFISKGFAFKVVRFIQLADTGSDTLNLDSGFGKI